MKFPARQIVGNLVWTREGTVWALWRVSPSCYPYLSTTEKLQLHRATRTALLALPAESMLLSLCQRVDPYEVADAMIGDVDLDAHPAWRRVVRRTIDMLDETTPFQRVHFVAVQLPTDGGKKNAAAALGAARSGVGETFGLPPAPVRQGEVATRQRQAQMLGSQLAGVLDLRPATAGEIRWIYARAPRRGLDEPFLDSTWEPTTRVMGSGPDARLAGPSLASLGDGKFKEGGVAEDPNRPRHRRYLRIETEAGVAFTAVLAISDMPHSFRFPDGAEWFFAADAAPFPVDWCARIRSVPNRDAQLKARRQARQLVGQAEEYEGEPSGPPQTLDEAAEAIDDMRAQLAANPADPELQTSLLFATWSDDLATLEEQVVLLRQMYTASEYDMHRPTGSQLALFQAMLPGVTQRPAMRDYVQYLLPRDLAAGMPFASSAVGDPQGMLLGYTLDGGTFRPVLFDPAYGPSINKSASLGAFGDLGSGKSYFIKTVAYATLAKGGQVVAIDGTSTGEYVDFARVVPKERRSQVVTLAANSNVCLDPLRIFSGPDRVNHTIGFLTLLTGISPQDLEGVTLEEAVQNVARRPDGRLRDVIDELQAAAAEDPDANVVYRKLRNFANNELGRLAFGDGEVLRLDADYICFHLAGLDLPRQEELVNEHLYRRLLPRQIVSQALLYLVAAVTRSVVFADPTRFAAALWDEVWRLTSSAQGRALALEFTKDGRKHFGALWVLGQDADTDLADEALAGLLANRFVFRHAKGRADSALRFMSMDPSEGAVQLLQTASEGRCLYRDVRGRTGYIQILPAADAELRAAFDTNPTTRVSVADGPDDNDEPDADEAELVGVAPVNGSANGHSKRPGARAAALLR